MLCTTLQKCLTNRFLLIKHMNIRFIATNESLHQLQRETNSVELLGTIEKLLFVLPSGKRSILVRTAEPENRHYYHLVSTRTKKELDVGKRVHLFGNISSQNYYTETKQLRQKLIVKAHELDFADHRAHKDRNIVEMAAQVISSIDNTADYSAFTLATHHIPKGGAMAGIVVTEQHQIVVRDQPALNIVRFNLKKSDWVSLNGNISYTFRRNSRGKLFQSGYILANDVALMKVF